MWVSSIVWFLLAMMLGIGISRVVNSYKPILMIFAVLQIPGGWLGFVRLEVAISIAVLGLFAGIYVLQLRGSSA
jgi:hypothetical protein